MTQLKGIVFDLDGTLMNSLEVTFEAFNHGIVSQGGRAHSPLEIMRYFGPGERQIFAAILGEGKADQAYAACREYVDRNLERIPLHEGVAELLEKLKSADIPIAIVTGRSWNTTEVILSYHDMLDRFVTVITNDHVSAPKPSPEGLRLALKRMHLDPAHALYVGDMPVDIQAAHSAGAGSVAALWDLTAKREELALHSPHHWAVQPRELLEILAGKHEHI
jgi:pyrophosphatase PpaX